MSLLTEQGKQRARDDWRESCPTWDEEHHLLIAQQTKTLKAVAEWMDGKCDQMIHGSITLGQRLRRDCCYCMRDMAEFAREGKMPGEEK